MNLTTLQAKQDILAEFYEFALKKREEKIQELINEEKLRKIEKSCDHYRMTVFIYWVF
ncbi:hypothetical protein MALH04_00130 [Mycoplasma anatis]|nr:hypothetical protein [Mycoplasmopsis anatis]